MASDSGHAPLQGSSRAIPIAQAASAFVLLTLLIVVIDRIGAPERLVAALAPAALLACLAAIGLSARTMQMSQFFAAGGAIAAPHAGLACAGLLLASALPVLAPLQVNAAAHAENLALLVAVVAGLALAACTVWPLLRANGAHSLADLLAARFGLRAFRLAAAGASACICALVALAGFKLALQTLVQATALPVTWAAVLLALVLACMCVPGGLGGTLRAALAASALVLVALGCGGLCLWLVGAGALGTVNGPAPAFSLQIAALAALQQAREAMPTLAGADQLLLMFPAALGLAVLPPLSQGAIVTPDGRAAFRAGISTLVWTLLLLAVSAALVAFASAALVAQVTDPQRLSTLLLERGMAETLQFCGKAAADLGSAKTNCTGVAGFGGTMRAQDVNTSSYQLLLSFPRWIVASPALRALPATLAVGLGLTMAAMGLQGLATALGHDALLRNSKGVLTSARLALTRLILLVALALLVGAALTLPLDPRAATGLALALGTALLAPPALLAFWPRASSIHALVAMLAGLVGLTLALATAGISAQFKEMAGAAMVGLSLAVIAGFGLSLTTRARPQNRALARALRRGALPALRHREGA